jgi:hypothetical protein
MHLIKINSSTLGVLPYHDEACFFGSVALGLVDPL